ncbi:hypothetical protein TEA_029125 [Camellia sinensis var. sinensis]|uniref:Auxin response factor domain-containing protein n=1 Tax=Camellia sinensis var. sinensis TaxID=542762 RepID=A0A4S4ECA7_CAMSN|nr:hypothetical protein TEA_029125 [Camellia sinensis var. sinensis]
MITVMNSIHKSMNESEECLDSQLWHACAGGMVQMPPVNSKVFYFPQGHAEHAHEKLDSGNFSRIPALVLCRVSGIKFLADTDTDEERGNRMSWWSSLVFLAGNGDPASCALDYGSTS